MTWEEIIAGWMWVLFGVAVATLYQFPLSALVVFFAYSQYGATGANVAFWVLVVAGFPIGILNRLGRDVEEK